ncbi:MAG: carboxymuconolactone decarboxylase family protein [Candidatus Methanofastidiosia archaeon]
MVSIIEKNYEERWAKYKKFIESIMSDNKESNGLDLKTKELIAIVVSIINKCDICVEHHVTKALDCGVTEKEIADAISVMLLLRGFPEEIWSRKIVTKAVRKYKKRDKGA